MQSSTYGKPNPRVQKLDRKKPYGVFDQLRKSWYINLLFFFLIPAVSLLCCEWVARGTLVGNSSGNGFSQAFFKHMPSFLIAYLLFLSLYILLVAITGGHKLASITTSLLGFVPAVVTYYKLTMRGEPFLPWDFGQIDELLAISGDVSLQLHGHMFAAFFILATLCVAAAFAKLPQRRDWISRLFMAAGSAGCALLLLFGIFLNPNGSQSIGIQEDSWMQDRYYRNHGVVTGFLTNLQLLDIEKPAAYNQQAVHGIWDETLSNAAKRNPYYSGSYTAGDVQTPDIIYVMAESFWDVTALDGIEYDQEILPNLTALREEGAYGYAYTPSFGGGTCDVEFEALTGFSMEHLPSGSKPYQQYVTKKTVSLPNYLKDKGYDTVAIHGYGAKFWSRNTAYPNLGLDTFIDSSQFVNPTYRRGFISDDSMVNRILEEYENNSDGPVFIHAVTMQNHTTYSRDRYPESQLVSVVRAPDALSDSVIGQLEDCATGIREMDAALGKLCDALRESDRPTIVVFWGDHLNPMSDGYSLFEETGFIDKGDTGSPELHKTPLLIWSNYSDEAIDLGTIATYNLSPVMMDIYGLEMPEYFEFLMQNMETLHAKTRGVVVQPDGTYGEDLTEAQQAIQDNQAVLQYDLMFGAQYTEAYLASLE